MTNSNDVSEMELIVNDMQRVIDAIDNKIMESITMIDMSKKYMIKQQKHVLKIK